MRTMAERSGRLNPSPKRRRKKASAKPAAPKKKKAATPPRKKKMKMNDFVVDEAEEGEEEDDDTTKGIRKSERSQEVLQPLFSLKIRPTLGPMRTKLKRNRMGTNCSGRWAAARAVAGDAVRQTGAYQLLQKRLHSEPIEAVAQRYEEIAAQAHASRITPIDANLIPTGERVGGGHAVRFSDPARHRRAD